MSGARHFNAVPLKTEVSMSISKVVRQFHRWVSIAFTLTVIANFAAMTQGTPPAWITYSPLLPLFLLLLTGLYMFFLPYFSRRRGGGGESRAS
jgi:ABC-type polysaccharide/polyol phosphate export permease